MVFQSVSVYKWVNLTRLSYGVPDEEISKVLSHYGQIKQVKQEQYSHVYTGVRNILMEVTQEIPLCMRIAGHLCNIFYKGQKRVCFTCQKEGHFSWSCPSKAFVNPSDIVDDAVLLSREPVVPAVPVHDAASTLRESASSSVNTDVLSPVTEVLDGLLSSVTTTVGVIVPVCQQPPVVSSVVAHVANLEVMHQVSHIPTGSSVVLPSVLPPGSVALDHESMVAIADEVPALSPRPAPQSTSAGCKRDRARSKSRSKSRSPLCKGGRCDSSSSSDGSSVDGYSSASDNVPSLVDPGSENVPVFSSNSSPDNFFASLSASDLMDDPLTQYTPNLPCATQDRIKFPSEPEDSQLSDESHFIAHLVNSISPSPEGESSFLVDFFVLELSLVNTLSSFLLILSKWRSPF